jgi:hypothetical protein
MPPLPSSPGVGVLTWLDPRLLDCGCRRCRRGGRCRWMQGLYQDCANRDDRAGQLACLTDDDLAWLIKHGWDGD